VSDEIIPVQASTFEYPDGPRAGQRGVVMVFAVRRRGHLILVDTGIGHGNAEIEDVYKPAGDGLIDALKAHGVDVERVEAVVNSHLHFDHCGENALFPGIPIYVQEAEWLATQSADYTVGPWVRFAGARYRRVDGDHSVVPGIRLISTPGHTPGHQSVAVDLNDALVVLAGQACYSPDEWTGASPDIDGADSAWNPVSYVSSLERLRRFQPETVWFGHSTEPWMRP
jgi:N-acyl homoserine lactone hydrolase